MTLTLAEYAATKRLPPDFLHGLGLREEAGSLLIPYRGQDGREIAVRRRLSMNGTRTFAWPKGTPAKGLVYGLDRFKLARAEDYALLVEGESDAQTAWLYGIPAFGIPGAGMFDDELTSPCLEGIGTLYVVQEPGEAGERFVEALRGSGLAERVRVLRLPSKAKDLSDLHLILEGDRAAFRAAIVDAVSSAMGEDPLRRPVRFALGIDEFIAARSELPPALIGDDEEIILPATGLAILFAKGGRGKTTLTIDAALHLASGLDWLGFTVPRPLRVLLIENEGPREPFRRKLEAKRRVWKHEIKGAVFVHVLDWGALTLADDEQAERLREFIVDERIDLVVGDPLDSLGIEGVGSPADTREFMLLMSRVGLFRNVAFWLLHHPRKESAGDELDEAAGAWGGKPDTMLKLEVLEGNRSRLSFPKVRWSRRGKRSALILGFDPDTEGFSVLSEEQEGERDYLSEIRELLSDGEWRTAKEIAAPKVPKPPKDETERPAKRGIGAYETTVKGVLEGNPETFVSCNGKDVGRSPLATVWNCVRPQNAVTQLVLSKGESAATALLRSPIGEAVRVAVHPELRSPSSQLPSDDTLEDGGW